jgi:hypothetical protein
MILKRTSTSPHTSQRSAIHDCIEQRQDRFDFLNDEATLETLDRQLGHQYIPMDIYVDSTTIKEHFQVSCIQARCAGSYHSAA